MVSSKLLFLKRNIPRACRRLGSEHAAVVSDDEMEGAEDREASPWGGAARKAPPSDRERWVLAEAAPGRTACAAQRPGRVSDVRLISTLALRSLEVDAA